jgi:hypothetical protein
MAVAKIADPSRRIFGVMKINDQVHGLVVDHAELA